MSLAGLGKIVGKEIARVLVIERESAPRWQLFLLFSDDTYFDLYGEECFAGTKGVDDGGIEDVLRQGGKIAFDTNSRTELHAQRTRDEALRNAIPITDEVQ